MQYKIMQGGILYVICTCRMKSSQKSFFTNEGLLTSTTMFVPVQLSPHCGIFESFSNRTVLAAAGVGLQSALDSILTYGHMPADLLSLWTNLTSVTFLRCFLI